jgi:streptogramin lyase
VNDTFLYAGSWNDRAIISYKYENASWTTRTFVSVSGSGTGSHLAVDDCGRVWFIITDFGLRIFDSSGMEIANWNMSTSSSIAYDLLLLPNYVLLVTMRQAQQLRRFDPQVSCS